MTGISANTKANRANNILCNPNGDKMMPIRFLLLVCRLIEKTDALKPSLTFEVDNAKIAILDTNESANTRLIRFRKTSCRFSADDIRIYDTQTLQSVAYVVLEIPLSGFRIVNFEAGPACISILGVDDQDRML